MKNLYWIVCGVLVLGLLVTWMLLVPSDEARKSKQALDQQTNSLLDLEKRADAGDPIGPFDPENPADTDTLAKQFLITERWRNVLQPLVEKYQHQLDGIKGQLIARDAWLRRPVAQTSNLNEWYNAYLKASEDLLAKLKKADCVRIPVDTGTTITNPGEFPRALRDTVGLFTKSDVYPEPSKHALLTTHLHALEVIADRLIDAKIAVGVNPLIGQTGHGGEDSSAAAVTIAAVAWTGGPDQVEQVVQTGISGLLPVRALSLTLTLEGSPSALLSAVAHLDRNTEPDRPLITISAGTMQRRANYAAAERYDVAAEPATIILDISLLTFGDPAAAAAAAAPPGAAPPAPAPAPAPSASTPPTAPGVSP